jgi:hypothetical protein
MGGGEHHGGFHGGGRGPHPMVFVGVLMFHWLFCMAATVCFLGAINRAACALKLMSRVKALHAVPEAFTEQERAVLIHKITTRALGSM